MIARVAICRDALGPGENVRDSHRAKALRARIQDRGIALFASMADQRRFLASLNGRERTCWTALASSERKLVYALPDGLFESIHEHETLAELRATYGDEVDVIVCGREHAVRLGIPESFLLEESGEPSVGALPDVDCAKALNPDEQESGPSRLVPAGTPREEVWERHFRAPATLCSDILIVDRFAYDQAATGRYPGFRWMIDELLRDRKVAEPIRLQVVVQQRTGDLPVESQLTDAIEQLGLKDPSSAFRSVTVRLATTSYGVHHLHDRFVRFDGRVVCSTLGLSILGTSQVRAQASVFPGDFSDSEAVWRDLKESGVVLTASWRARHRMWTGADNEMLLFEEDAA